QPVHDPARREHELPVAASAGKAELVVALAQVRVARAAAPAGAPVAEPFAHDALAGGEVAHPLPHLLDHAAPLVTRDAGIGDPASIELAGEHLEVGAAHAGQPAADEYVA